MVHLRLPFALTALVAIAVQATTLGDNLALLQRQAPGTPKFECHSNCGNALAGGRLEGHCTNSTWTELYENCLDCALEFDIWQHYSNGLTAAASTCGLTPTPDPADAEETGSASGSTTSTAGASSTPVAPSTTAPPTSPAATTTPVTAGAAGLQAMSWGGMIVAGVGALAAL